MVWRYLKKLIHMHIVYYYIFFCSVMTKVQVEMMMIQMKMTAAWTIQYFPQVIPVKG